MNTEALVSMITYCYNGERFVSKYFDAILAQNYSNIELIFFNNGSEDRTGEIAESYRERLENKGVKVNIIHYKENQSTCKLKQDAFQMMTGEYFFGCDSDDYIDPDYIKEMSEYLTANPEKGIVYCQLRMVNESTNEVIKIMKMIPRKESKKAFEDILLGENINFTAISYMMSRKHFETINPEKTIYISRYVENYQVQMPFLYNDLQGYIEKPLGQYTVRDDSYSGTLNPMKKVTALKGQEESVLATLKQINPTNMDYYADFAKKRIRRDRFFSSLHLKDKEIAKECYAELKECNGVNCKVLVRYFLYQINILDLLYKIFRK